MFSAQTRRDFLRATAAACVPTWFSVQRSFADESKSPNARPRIGAIGVGGRGSGIAAQAKRFGDVLAVCDVDRSHAERAAKNDGIGAGKADIYEDYRKLLDRKDIDVVTIGTPDHWHTRIVLDALKAGKDVYCEKPLTLTIDEGKKLRDAVKASRRVVQVGTQQRSEFRNMFLTAVALVREGRLGKVRRVTCAIGGAPRGQAFAASSPPPGLNWDFWLGQAPKVDYIKERCHNTFRWWYEYSGGKMTDWGAHHVDIAQWAIGMEESGPTSIEVLLGEHPVAFKDGQPTVSNTYNTATRFTVRCLFPNGVELLIRDSASDLGFDNGIQFEGEQGKFFVSRSRLTGEVVDHQKTTPLPERVFLALRKGKRLDGHMANFMECVRDRSEPVSDVASHHRALTTCHLANIALRLGRKLTWDPKTEQIVGDPEANGWQAREQRKGYEV